MTNFAKVFNSAKYGQIVVFNQTDDEGKAELRFFAKPPSLGVCSVAIGFGDSEEDFAKCDKVFAGTELSNAEGVVRSIFALVGEEL